MNVATNCFALHGLHPEIIPCRTHHLDPRRGSQSGYNLGIRAGRGTNQGGPDDLECSQGRLFSFPLNLPVLKLGLLRIRPDGPLVEALRLLEANRDSPGFFICWQIIFGGLWHVDCAARARGGRLKPHPGFGMVKESSEKVFQIWGPTLEKDRSYYNKHERNQAPDPDPGAAA